MAQGPPFKFYFLDENNNYYTATPTEAGWDINANAAKVALKDTPINWNDTQITWKRDSTYLGVFRSLSTQFKWPFSYDNYMGDGAAILKYIYNTQEAQGELMMLVEIRIDTESYPGAGDVWRYETFYQSEIDFSKIIIDEQNCNVTINTLDGKLYELLKAYGDTSYNIPFDITDPDWKLLEMDPVELYAQYQFVGPDFLDASPVPTKFGDATNPIVFNQHVIPTLEYIVPTAATNNPNQPGISPQTIGVDVLKNIFLSGQQVFGLINFPQTSPRRLFTDNMYAIYPVSGNQTLDVQLQCTLDFSANAGFTPGASTIVLKAFLVKTDNTNVIDPTVGASHTILLGSVTLNQSSPQTNLSFVANAPASNFQAGYVYTLAFRWEITGGPGGTVGITTNVTKIWLKIDGGVYFPTSLCQAYTLSTVFNKLTKVLASTQGNYGFAIPPISTPYAGVSNYLSDIAQTRADNYDTIPAFLYMVSGNALRQFNYAYPYQIPASYPINQQYLQLTPNNFLKSMFVMLGCAMGIEGDNLRLEPLKYFFDETIEIADLGEVINLTWEPYTQIMGNNFTVGYANQNYNLAAPIYTSGMNEFNLQQSYQLPITRVVNNKISLQNPFRADCIGIEYQRANQSSTSETDSQGDNDCFFVEGNGLHGTVTYQPPGYNSTFTVPAYHIQRYTSAIMPTVTSYGNPNVAPFIGGLTYGTTMYNYGLSPKRCAYRLGSYLHSICYNLDSESLRFQGTLKTNYIDPISNLNAGLIDEYADIPVSSLAAPLHKPRLIKFQCSPSTSVYKMVNDNLNANQPKGYFSFYWKGIKYMGFINQAAQRVADNGLVDFELLPLAGDDYSKL